MSTARSVIGALALAMLVQSARADRPYPAGDLIAKRAYVLTVQYKQLPPISYDVPLDKAGWGDVCAMHERSGGQVNGFNVTGTYGVRFSIKGRPGDQFAITFRARKLFDHTPAAPQPQIPSDHVPPPKSIQNQSNWEGTLTIGPGQTVTLPLDGADWHATVMRVTNPPKVVPGTEGNDPCWPG